MSWIGGAVLALAVAALLYALASVAIGVWFAHGVFHRRRVASHQGSTGWSAPTYG